MIAIFFGTVAVNAMNDYTGSLSLQAAGLSIRRPVSAGVVAVLSFLATLYLYYNNFSSTVENYLLVITYWIGPWAAIVLIDWRRAATGSTAAGPSVLGCFRAASTRSSRWPSGSSSRSRS